MALTKRTQILMEPEMFEHLERLSRRRKTSVGELIREALREKYLRSRSRDRARELVERLCAIDLPVDDWPVIEEELLARYDDQLP